MTFPEPQALARQLPPDLAHDRVVGTDTAAAYAGYSTSHFRSLVNQGLAPAPIRLSARKLGWKVSALRAWIASKEAAAA